MYESSSHPSPTPGKHSGQLHEARAFPSPSFALLHLGLASSIHFDNVPLIYRTDVFRSVNNRKPSLTDTPSLSILDPNSFLLHVASLLSLPQSMTIQDRMQEFPKGNSSCNRLLQI
mmetsp:Transcript_16005/g.34641  ORF Transcript_16005/g.34641 Transcript_16005/m.34641 type:complete len:116 (+) Transcript_16005:109-456(+)